jgi:anthranilate 1,2-dioxygenase small subunit
MKIHFEAAHVEAIRRLYEQYCHCLNRCEYDSWPGFFAAEASFEVRQIEDHERGLTVGLMFDANRRRIEDRVKFMSQIWKGSIEHYRTRHFIQVTRVSTANSSESVYSVDANLLVIYTPAEGVSAVLVSGQSIDEIELDAELQGRFRKRTVLLDGIPARALNYPI